MDGLSRRAVETVHRLDCARGVLAQLVGVSEAQCSRVLRDISPMTAELRPRFERALAFIETMAAQCAPYPCCFHDWWRLRPLWLEFQRSYGEARTAETREEHVAVQA